MYRLGILFLQSPSLRSLIDDFNFLVEFFDSYDVVIEWVSETLTNKSYEQELVEDMLTLMSSFSNKMVKGWQKIVRKRKNWNK